MHIVSAGFQVDHDLWIASPLEGYAKYHRTMRASLKLLNCSMGCSYAEVVSVNPDKFNDNATIFKWPNGESIN